MARTNPPAQATPHPIGLENSWRCSQEISINLLRDVGCALPRLWQVEQVLHRTRRFDNTIRYGTPQRIEDTFPKPLIRVLHEYLSGRPPTPQMLSAPDLIVDLSNLVLGSMRIVMHKAKAGTQRITVRFKRMVGELSGLVRSSSFAQPSAELCDDVAVRALLGLITPCLQLTSIDPATTRRQPAGVRNALAALDANRAEIGFYEQLLKRYVSRRPAPQPAPSEHGPDGVPRLIDAKAALAPRDRADPIEHDALGACM